MHTSIYYDTQEHVWVITCGTGRGSPARIYLFRRAAAALAFATRPGTTVLPLKQYRAGITFQLPRCSPVALVTLQHAANPSMWSSNT